MKISLSRSGGANERSFRVSPALVVASLALIVSLGGIAQSAIPSPEGKIFSCYVNDPDPDFSYVYILDHDKSCRQGETPLVWDQTSAANRERLREAFAKMEEARAAMTTRLPEIMQSIGKRLNKTEKKLGKLFSAKDLKGFSKPQRKALLEAEQVIASSLAAKLFKEDMFKEMTGVLTKMTESAIATIESLQDE